MFRLSIDFKTLVIAAAATWLTSAEALSDRLPRTSGTSLPATGATTGRSEKGSAPAADVAVASFPRSTLVAQACVPCNTGCFDQNAVCQPGTAAAACGTGGNVCTACSASQLCQNQSCVARPCSPGCVDGAGACQPGTTAGACGMNGNACVACPAGQICQGQTCVVPPCSPGCTDATGACQPGTTDAACGFGGNVCEACAGGEMCQGQQCVFDCSACECGCNASATACAKFPTCSISLAGVCRHQQLSCVCSCGGCDCE
jgi:hypothetical protein